MLNRNRRKREFMAEINITSLTDICLVLLIILLITSQFINDEGSLSVQLPDSKSASSADIPADKSIKIYVAENGEIKINGDITGISNLQNKILAILPQDGGKTVPVVVFADKALKYEKLVEVLDVLQNLNLNDVSLMVQKSGVNDEKK